MSSTWALGNTSSISGFKVHIPITSRFLFQKLRAHMSEWALSTSCVVLILQPYKLDLEIYEVPGIVAL